MILNRVFGRGLYCSSPRFAADSLVSREEGGALRRCESTDQLDQMDLVTKIPLFGLPGMMRRSSRWVYWLVSGGQPPSSLPRM